MSHSISIFHFLCSAKNSVFSKIKKMQFNFTKISALLQVQNSLELSAGFARKIPNCGIFNELKHES